MSWRMQAGDLRDRVRSTRSGRLTLQILVGILGGVLIIGGLILVPLPGPGWLIVLAGLAVLAAEFMWARRLLEFTRARLERWWRWLNRQNIAVRVLAGLVGLIFVAGVTAMTLSFSFGLELADVLP